MEFIDLKSQYKMIKADIHARINNVLEHGQYIMGPEINELEEKLATYVGVKHCIGVANGTDALLMALMALNIGAGDEVITSPFCFIAMAEMITLLGATPVFVDIDPKTFNIDPQQIGPSITEKTKAIMPVSLFGQCADFDAINALAKKHNLYVIEDAAQSFGATYKGKHSCGLSTIGCTSFYPSKPLGGYGDGGACFTDNDELARIMREIRVHGQDSHYHHARLGINGRLDTIQAAILLAKFKIFPDEIERRGQIAKRYTELLKDYVETPYIAPDCTSVYAQYTICVDERANMIEKLKQQDIPTAVHYPVPIHLQPAFKSFANNKLINSEVAANKVLSLPFSPYIKMTDIEKVCWTVKNAVQEKLNV